MNFEVWNLFGPELLIGVVELATFTQVLINWDGS